jgi:hypothetical protein
MDHTDDSTHPSVRKESALNRRAAMGATFAAAAAAGVVFSPKTAMARPTAALSPGTGCGANSTDIISVAADMEAVRNGVSGADALHAVAQNVAASTAPDMQIEFLAKFWGKVLDIRGTFVSCSPISPASYHY